MKLLVVNDEAHARPARDSREPQPDRDNRGITGSTFRFLVGEREHRLYPLNAEAIDYIQSDGNYVTIRSGNAKYISRDTIKRLWADLADFGFVRIERSLLVNIRAVAYVEAVGRGTFVFTLTSGCGLHSSASYRDEILRVLPMRRLSSRRLSP
jgi:two-component system, LytTR family, response regulator